jgi:hypothetical protein
MRGTFQRLLRLLVPAIVVALVGALSVHSQDKKRVITWPPYSVGKVERTGPGSQLSPVVDAVEIVSMEAAGHPIKVGQPFSADDDWLGSLTVRLKNISGQPISGAQISFSLPETQAPDQGTLMTTLRYGPSSSSRQPNEPHKLVAPNEEFELKLTDAEYEQARNRILQRGLSTGVIKLWISLTMVTFEDGTHWSSGCLKSSDPSNACP